MGWHAIKPNQPTYLLTIHLQLIVYICINRILALNNLQWLIYHKTQLAKAL